MSSEASRSVTGIENVVGIETMILYVWREHTPIRQAVVVLAGEAVGDVVDRERNRIGQVV
jgi:hypothetical protein